MLSFGNTVRNSTSNLRFLLAELLDGEFSFRCDKFSYDTCSKLFLENKKMGWERVYFDTFIDLVSGTFVC